MARRTPLPPPPPPAEIRAWPDRSALLADRAYAMGELTKRQLGAGRLTFFLLVMALVQLGWGFVGAALIGIFDDGLFDPLTAIFAAFMAAIGGAVMVPSVWLVVRGVRNDIACRERLAQWTGLDHDPAHDAKVREPVRSVVWGLLSFALCALGLWVSFAVPNMFVGPTRGGYGTVAYFLGAALILWVHGLIGLTKAYHHYRLAIRLGK
ncbi:MULTISPECIES: hypothetical protein [Streptomyces]|uniref:Uncharacterized protein n=1 Tax=Streptomyces solicathayae TaxID=3081768 RepID=A0ABZ0LV24_9ACTN|nr:hypothetical protein [Streptomyces sp. HUAS YS2]WOX22634.1 hypothetical protein R2D22_14985 [Streptomyces sp. HUAS YS2]